MLLGVVLVGRALEERAKLRATADMAALQVGWWGRGVGGEGQRHSLLLFNADWFLTLFSEGSPFPIPTLLPPLKSTRPPPPPPCRACCRPWRACCWATAAAGGRCPPSRWPWETCWLCCPGIECRSTG